MHMIEIYPDVVHMIEVVLIGLVVALVGAGGYVFFVSSMWADRNAQWRKIARQNPWDSLQGQDESDGAQKPALTKWFWIWLIALLISVLALILFVLAIKFEWIVSA